MKALTIKQPWASAIIYGSKDVENRSWKTNHRGPLVVHAGAGKFTDFDVGQWAKGRGVRIPVDRPTGAILGIVDVVNCVKGHDSPWAIEGQWHWILKNPKRIASPKPVKGRLGLWSLGEGIIKI